MALKTAFRHRWIWYRHFTRKDRRQWNYWGEVKYCVNIGLNKINVNAKINRMAVHTVNQAEYPERHAERFGVNHRVNKVNGKNMSRLNRNRSLLNPRQ